MPDSGKSESICDAVRDLVRRFAVSTDLDESLAGITSAAVDLIDAVHAASILFIDADQGHRSAATTSLLAKDLDHVQLQHYQGPCVAAAVGETMVIANDLDRDERWPQFSAAAVEAGVHSALSFQLYTHQKDAACRAALNLFSRDADGFDHEAQGTAAMLATHAAVVLVAQEREGQFQSALATRDGIGQAKGILMERFDIDARQAFELLRQLSQDSNTRLVDVAARIVAAGRADRR